MNDKIDHYDTAASIENQRELCTNGTPHFAPENGVCFKCGRQIYVPGGITVEQSKKLVTGCPFCHRSYCS